MPKLKLTESSVAKLRAPDPSGKQTLHWDHGHKDALAGFAVLCSGTTTSRTYVVQRMLPNGRNRRVTVGAVSELSLEKARALAADMLHALRHGNDPKAKIDNPTLRETLEKYLTARRDLRPASVTLYRFVVEKNLTAWLDRPLREITGDMVEKRHRAIAASINDKKGNDRISGAVSANAAMRCFRTLHNFAAERTPDLPPNPVRILRKQWFKERTGKNMVPEEKMADFHRAVCALEHPVQRDYILMMLFTGMRRTECASLRWADIDFAKRTFRAQADTTKSDEELCLPMSDIVFRLLMDRQREGRDAGGYVFPGRIAGQHINGIAPPLKIVAKASGVLVTAHDLRRTFINIAEDADIPWNALKNLVNHAVGGDVTKKHYLQRRIEKLREPTQRVADKIKLLCGIVDVVGDNIAKLSRAS
jgi:integrase